MSKFAEIKDLSEILKNRRRLIVGDIHGCMDELELLLNHLKFGSDDVLISIGDITDRGPRSFDVIEFCRDLQNKGRFYACRGNHDDRLIRYLKGKPVKIKHGLQLTLDDINKSYSGSLTMDQYKEQLYFFFKTFPRIIKLPGNDFCVHAGFNPYNAPDQQTKEDCIYMRYFGGKDFFDNINGEYWFKKLDPHYPRIFFGHEYLPDHDPLGNGKVVALDGGCVFGEYMRIWDSNDNKVHEHRALKTYHVNNYETPEQRLQASKKHFEENKEIL